jgi:hypothetical protein
MFREETESGKIQREVGQWSDKGETTGCENILADITSDFVEEENSNGFVEKSTNRRERNRASARGCRLRKKARIERLGTENEELKQINKAQEQEIERLQMTVKLLNQQLDMIVPKNEKEDEELLLWL